MRKFVLMALMGLCFLGAKAQEGVIANGFWDNWWLQAGLDMSLQCPYGKDFGKVFPQGKTFGVDAAVGKWWSPFIAARFHLGWENGIPLFRNDHLRWLATSDDGKSNMDCGGFVMMTLDVPLSLSNIIAGYDADRPWNGYVFARAGVAHNFAISSTNPIVGGGFGAAYRIADRLSVSAEASVQATTSDFYHGVSMTGMSVPTGFNCFFAIELGVQYTLGTSTWRSQVK